MVAAAAAAASVSRVACSALSRICKRANIVTKSHPPICPQTNTITTQQQQNHQGMPGIYASTIRNTESTSSNTSIGPVEYRTLTLAYFNSLVVGRCAHAFYLLAR